MIKFIFQRVIEIFNKNPENNNITSALIEYKELLSNSDIRSKYKASIDELLLSYSDEFQKIKEVQFEDPEDIYSKVEKTNSRVDILSDTVNELILSSME